MYNHDDDSFKTKRQLTPPLQMIYNLCAKSFYLCRLEKAAMRLSLCPVSSWCDLGNIKWGRSKTTNHRNIDHKKKQNQRDNHKNNNNCNVSQSVSNCPVGVILGILSGRAKTRKNSEPLITKTITVAMCLRLCPMSSEMGWCWEYLMGEVKGQKQQQNNDH